MNVLLTVVVRCPKADMEADPHGDEHYMLTVHSHVGTIELSSLTKLQSCRCGVASSEFVLMLPPLKRPSQDAAPGGGYHRGMTLVITEPPVAKVQSLDLVFEEIYDLVRDHEFAKIDAILDAVDVEMQTPEMLVGYLSASNPAKRYLAARVRFMERVEKKLRRDAHYDVDGLLRGLR